MQAGLRDEGCESTIAHTVLIINDVHVCSKSLSQYLSVLSLFINICHHLSQHIYQFLLLAFLFHTFIV